MDVFDILTFSAVVVVCVYCLFIFICIYGWKKIKLYTPDLEQKFSTKISIIIPARNEEKNIIACIERISKQSYPQELFEIIVIDDDSIDKTSHLVDMFREQRVEKNLRLIHQQTSPDIVSHKKKAIETGIELATGDLIITTDADCVVQTDWLKTIVSYYEQHKPKMIIGPVGFYDDESVFCQFQTYELISIAGITAAAVYFGHPVMSSGANLVYERSAFYNVKGFHKINHLASGDDVLLMNKFKKLFPQEIHYLKASEALVLTKPVKKLSEFIQQRIRWTSKNFSRSGIFSALIGLIILLSNILPPAGMLITFFSGKFIIVFIILWLIKFVIDVVLLNTANTFFKKTTELMNIMLLELTYPLYVFLIALFSLRGKYIWKQRSVR